MRLTIALFALLIVGVGYAQPLIVNATTVSITKSGKIYHGDKPVSIGSLVEEIRRASPYVTKVYVRAENQADYEALSKIIAVLNSAKLEPLLVTK